MKKKRTKLTPDEVRLADYRILLRPVITEKSSLVGGERRRVVFRVEWTASKDDIRGAVERAFNVKVARVNTAKFLGKPKRTMRSDGRRSHFKKAYVTLKEGYSIDVVEGL